VEVDVISNVWFDLNCDVEVLEVVYYNWNTCLVCDVVMEQQEVMANN